MQLLLFSVILWLQITRYATLSKPRLSPSHSHGSLEFSSSPSTTNSWRYSLSWASADRWSINPSLIPWWLLTEYPDQIRPPIESPNWSVDHRVPKRPQLHSIYASCWLFIHWLCLITWFRSRIIKSLTRGSEDLLALSWSLGRQVNCTELYNLHVAWAANLQVLLSLFSLDQLTDWLWLNVCLFCSRAARSKSSDELSPSALRSALRSHCI